MAQVALTRGMVAIIDDADIALVAESSWSASAAKQTFYAKAKIKGRTYSMHRIVLDAKPGEIVDHINGNGLDNRRANLRIVSASLNAANCRRRISRTGFRGVEPSGALFVARYSLRGQRHKVGPFDSAEAAARAYDAAMLASHGSGVPLNFPAGVSS